VAVNAVAVVAMLAVGGYLAVSLWREKPALPPKPPAVAKQTPPARPAPVPKQLMAQYGAGRRWHYRVSVEPAQWRDAMLIYRVADRDGIRAVDTEFTYKGGNMNFRLGV